MRSASTQAWLGRSALARRPFTTPANAGANSITVCVHERSLRQAEWLNSPSKRFAKRFANLASRARESQDGWPGHAVTGLKQTTHSKPATMAQIAERAGVALSTVSYVLSG